jgi:hypothetical protein
MTELFIHIGAPKTGTTAIQQYLLKHRDTLARQGVLYPTGGLLKTAHHVIGAAVFPGRSSRLEGISRKEALTKSLAKVREEIAELKPRTVILSTEYLWGDLSPADIRSLLQPFSDHSIKIIAYLRRQDLLAQSLYVQAVKGGASESFPDWLRRVVTGEKAGFDFYKVLSSWKNAGVPADIVVRVYEKSQLKGNICVDFMSAVCPAMSQVPPPGDHIANSGPDRATVELLRLISRTMPAGDLAIQVRKRILTRSPARALFEPLNYLPGGEANEFLGRYAKQNEAVARQFLNRTDGVLFREAPPVAKGPVVEEVAASVILDRLLGLLPGLIADKATDTGTVKKQPPHNRPADKKQKSVDFL